MQTQAPAGGLRKKATGPIVKAFRGRLDDWVDCDAQLGDVLRSIANLRDRIWWSSRQAASTNGPPTRIKAWHGCGFRPTENSFLSPEDIETAMSYDLLQHEKMLSACRAVSASMAQAQDAMARRLDEFMMAYLEDTSDAQISQTFDEMQLVYMFLGDQLYERQLMVKKILASCHPGLVDAEASQNHEDEGNPRQVARQCYKRLLGLRSHERWQLVGEFNTR